MVTIEERIIDDSEDTDENLQPRTPVVVVMGHEMCIRDRVMAGPFSGQKPQPNG